MIRFLNMLALIAVIASATWAYSVKYETILVAEKLKKREAELNRERDAVAILQAEWHLFNRPVRMQSLAKPEAGMQPTSAKQIARAADIPQAMPDKGDRLDALLTGSISTPDGARKTLTSRSSPKSTGATPAPASRAPGMTSRAVTAATTTGAARGTAKAMAGQPLSLRANGQARLVPPAKIGPTTRVGVQTRKETAAVAPEPAREPVSSNPLTGFLRRLIQ